MKLSIIILTVVGIAYAMRDIVPSSPYAISIVIATGYDRVSLGFGLYQVLAIYNSVRELNRVKPDIIVWLTENNGTATADEILREQVSTELFQFLDTFHGLFFLDGHYFCSEYANTAIAHKGSGPMRDFAILKMKAWKLTMYKKVVHYDLDILPIAPSGFDRMFGVWGAQNMWERNLLDEQDVVATVLGAPVHAGIMILKPSKSTYRNLCRTALANANNSYEQTQWGNIEKFQNPFCEQNLFDDSPDYRGGGILRRHIFIIIGITS